MEQNRENVVVGEVKKTKEAREQPLAMDMLHHISKVSKLWIAFACVAFAGIALLLVHQMNINYQNDKDWRELFSSYDYVSQDGNGQNYYNSEIGGNVNNGATDTETIK